MCPSQECTASPSRYQQTLFPRLTRSSRAVPHHSNDNKEVSARTLASVAFPPRSQLPERSDSLCLCEAQPKVKPLFYALARQRHRDHNQISNNHQHSQRASPSNHSVGAQFCRRLLLGTWNNRTLVLDLAPPQLPPSEQPNRLAKNCDDLLEGLEKGDPIPACTAPCCPPRVLAPDPAPIISLSLNIDRQQGASWYARSEHIY